jgi:hypothetical protein
LFFTKLYVAKASILSRLQRYQAVQVEAVL